MGNARYRAGQRHRQGNAGNGCRSSRRSGTVTQPSPGNDPEGRKCPATVSTRTTANGMYTDADCPRFPCTVYREGFADGDAAGRASGFAAGVAEGCAEGYAEATADAGAPA